MLSMTEIKIKEEVKGMERELLEVGRMIVEEEAIRREKIAGCNAAREMHEAQVFAIPHHHYHCNSPDNAGRSYF